MNITKDIISDLLPLYVASECSGDTRALVEEYLRQHPEEGAELRRIMSTSVGGAVQPAKSLPEMEVLRNARRRVRRWAWLLALAIFFSLTPFSFVFGQGGHFWLLRESPVSAAIYGIVGIAFWVAYFIFRRRSRTF